SSASSRPRLAARGCTVLVPPARSRLPPFLRVARKSARRGDATVTALELFVHSVGQRRAEAARNCPVGSAAPAIRDRRAPVAAKRLRAQLDARGCLPALVLGPVDQRDRALDGVAVE